MKRSIGEILNNFKKETGVDLFKAIEVDGILLGMGFITSELELSKKLLGDLTYYDKIEKLKNIYVKSKLQTDFFISNKEVEEAILKSFHNSLLGIVKYRKDFRYSEWLLTNTQVINICQKYDNVLNPLLFKFKVQPESFILSVFQDEKLGLDKMGARNGTDRNGKQKFRAPKSLAKPGMFYIMNSQKTLKSIYHPLVWFLLSNNTLDNFLDEETKERLQLKLDELFTKQKRIMFGKRKK